MQEAPQSSAAQLAESVLEGEALRQSLTANSEPNEEAADLLTRTGSEVGLGETIKAGGVSYLAVSFLLNMVEEFDRVAVAVLAPDIQKSLDVSTTVLAGLAGAGGVFYVIGGLGIAWIADRKRRTGVLGLATILWSMAVAITGRISHPFLFFLARCGVGVGGSARTPIIAPMLSDAYPLQARGRVLATEQLGRPLGQVLGPIFAGAIAAAVGGANGWRWAFAVFAIPGIFLGWWAFVLPDPKRGQEEQRAILGSTLGDDDDQPPVRLSAAFARLKKVRSFYFLVVGIGVLGFALVAVPLQFSLLLEEDPSYGYGAYTRGWIIAIAWTLSLAAIPLGGIITDRLFRRNPQQMLVVSGSLIVAYGLLVFVGLRFKSVVLLIAFYALANAVQSMAFTAIGPTIGAVVPFRMRGQAFSLIGVYIFLMGGFFGGLLAGAFSDRWGPRTSLTLIVFPASLIGGVLIMYGSRYLRRDIALAVSELQEEQQERIRQAESPEDTPVIQVRNLNVSYGPVQVLFDVNMDVRRGEVLALLGTNGAGKSTLLRAIGGLVMPDRGVVRLNGRTITLVEPEYRAKLGIVQVPGGEAVFPTLTVQENLDVWLLGLDTAEREARLQDVFETFPIVATRLNEKAGSLSGGQQQMLALSKALIQEPTVLCIDELSLGLAPIIVQDLLVVIEKLKQRGITMVIVEQSVNVALSIADRAIFMERGEVRFEGPAQDLLGRDDLLRAVFLSGAGA